MCAMLNDCSTACVGTAAVQEAPPCTATNASWQHLRRKQQGLLAQSLAEPMRRCVLTNITAGDCCARRLTQKALRRRHSFRLPYAHLPELTLVLQSVIH